MTLRDEIARVIDPDAFYDGLRTDCLGMYWHSRRFKALEQAGAILALLRPGTELPEGVVVPREPTDAMIEAAEWIAHNPVPHETYRAMIAAAKEPTDD